jgi:hypothetical protein
VARINRDLPNREVRSFRSQKITALPRGDHLALRRLVFCEFCDGLVAAQPFADRLFTICNSAELEKTWHASRHMLRKIYLNSHSAWKRTVLSLSEWKSVVGYVAFAVESKFRLWVGRQRRCAQFQQRDVSGHDRNGQGLGPDGSP